MRIFRSYNIINMTRKIEKLTAQEEDAMLVVWQQKGGTVKDFLGQMPEPRPPYTTLASVIKNLVRKGYVAAQKVGNTYYYTPAISEEEYKRCFLSDIVRNYFSNSYREMVSFFAEEQKLSQEELQEILHTIQEGKKI